MHVAFAVEGGSDAGLGHVYHSTAIADAFGDEVTSTFVTDSGEATRQKIRDRGFTVFSVESKESLVEVLASRMPAVVVFDLPWLDRDDVVAVRERLGPDVRIVVIGNRNNNLPKDIDPYCDVVVDFDIGESDRRSGRYVDRETETLNLVGLRYLILRPEFYEQRRPNTEKRDHERVLFMFGAADPSNFTSTGLSALLQSGLEYDVEVVLGAGFSHQDAFDSVLDSAPDGLDRVTVGRDVQDVATRMLRADVVVTSPGLTMMEALLLDRPVLAFYQNDLQRIWDCYSFVHGPERLADLEPLVRRVHTSFTEMASDLNLDFTEGKRQVLDAITRTYE